MRYMGIDFGTKKIGLALSDEEGSFAFPHAVIPNDSNALETVAHICEGERVGMVVMGRSLNYARQENAVMRNVRAFEKRLAERTALLVVYEDEALTTQEATREAPRDAGTDARAAALILESYLTHK